MRRRRTRLRGLDLERSNLHSLHSDYSLLLDDTQEMADQEKQQLLAALEEKQRSREEKAQQQEKMLQQLKAGSIKMGSRV